MTTRHFWLWVTRWQLLSLLRRAIINPLMLFSAQAKSDTNKSVLVETARIGYTLQSASSWRYNPHILMGWHAASGARWCGCACSSLTIRLWEIVS